MTKYFLLQELNDEALAEFLDICSKEENEKIVIILDSDGGFMEVSEAMIHLINSDPGRFSIIASGRVQSGALDLALLTHCKCTVLRSAHGLAHLPTREIDLRELPLSRSASKFAMEELLPIYTETYKARYRPHLSDEELKDFLDGHNIRIGPERLKKMIEKSY